MPYQTTLKKEGGAYTVTCAVCGESCNGPPDPYRAYGLLAIHVVERELAEGGEDVVQYLESIYRLRGDL